MRIIPKMSNFPFFNLWYHSPFQFFSSSFQGVEKVPRHQISTSHSIAAVMEHFLCAFRSSDTQICIWKVRLIRPPTVCLCLFRKWNDSCCQKLTVSPNLFQQMGRGCCLCLTGVTVRFIFIGGGCW